MHEDELGRSLLPLHFGHADVMENKLSLRWYSYDLINPKPLMSIDSVYLCLFIYNKCFQMSLYCKQPVIVLHS